MNAAAEVAAERLRRASEALFTPAVAGGAYDLIVRAVADGLGCAAAGIGRCVGEEFEILAACCDGQSLPPARLALADSPYARLFGGEPHTVRVLPLDGHGEVLPGAADASGFATCCGLTVDGADGRPAVALWALGRADQACIAGNCTLLQVAAARLQAELARVDSVDELRESEARMRLALEAGGLGLWEWDVVNDTYVHDERWAAIRGYARDDITPVFEDYHPEDAPRLVPLRDALFDGSLDAYEVDYRVAHRDGGWRWINARTKVIRREAGGRPARIVGVQMDIDERLRAEEVARAERQLLRLAVDATELGLWDWDVATDGITWSARSAQMLGYAPGELPATTRAWAAINHPDDQPEVARQFREHVRGRLPQIRVELRARARDGHWVWILSHGRVIARNESGRALRAVGTHQDISQLKYAELALRESEARLRTVIENLPVGTFLTDEHGHIVYINLSFLGLGADDAGNVVGARWLEAVHPDDRADVAARWAEYVAAPVAPYDIEWRALVGDDERLLRVRAEPIHERGRTIGFAGALEDVTEQRAAEARERALAAQLRQAQKTEALGRLTGGIAHDFNNSLATILGFTSLALARPAADARLTDYLQSIAQAGERARDLVRKLLEFSRSGPAEHQGAIDIARQTTEVLRVLQALIPATLRIEARFEPALPPVRLDASDLHQVLFNLVLNARDASSGHGRIEVSVARPDRVVGCCAACQQAVDGEYLRLVVSDDGRGIPEADLPRIFDPFFSTKEVGQGTGMGLAVLHGVVHRAGGHVLVESGAHGTRMTVLLQRAETPVTNAAGVTTASPASAAPASRRARVLVVDDEAALARFLGEWLEGEGYECRVFVEPQAALAWGEYAGDAYDILLTDQTMPGMTGLELASALRMRRPGLPVIVCTGLADRVDPQAAADLGIERLFIKPVPLDELRAVLGAASARTAAIA